MNAKEIQEALAKPFPEESISWRVGSTNDDKTKGLALAYIDARDVMKRLDDVVGIGGWQDRYPFKGCCEISIKIGEEWITKSNGAGETKVEAEKGEFSDAFKRAAVMWGIGRYLYDLGNTWVNLKKQGNTHVIDGKPSMPKWALPSGSTPKQDPKPEQKPEEDPAIAIRRQISIWLMEIKGGNKEEAVKKLEEIAKVKTTDQLSGKELDRVYFEVKKLKEEADSAVHK